MMIRNVRNNIVIVVVVLACLLVGKPCLAFRPLPAVVGARPPTQSPALSSYTFTNAVQSLTTTHVQPCRRQFLQTQLFASLEPQNVTPKGSLPPKEEDNDDKDGPSSPLVKLAASPLGALAVITFVVLFHELGHYLAAKSLKVLVDEFSVGMGPKVVGFQALWGGGDTTFSLRALPLGGYVSVNAMSMMALPWWLQLRILSAGVFFNLVLASMIYTGQMWLGQGLPVTVFDSGVVVGGLDQESAAQGLLFPGDVIQGINGKMLHKKPTTSEMKVHRVISKLIDQVHQTPDGSPVVLTVLNPKTGKTRNVQVLPKQRQGQDNPSLGVFLFPNVVGVDLRKTDNPWEASALAVSMVANLSSETAIGLVTFAKDVVSGKAKSSEYQISGPVSVVKRASEVVQTQDWDIVLKYMAAASINLGVLNLFPIPPSDGFQILFTTLQGLLHHAQL